MCILPAESAPEAAPTVRCCRFFDFWPSPSRRSSWWSHGNFWSAESLVGLQSRCKMLVHDIAFWFCASVPFLNVSYVQEGSLHRAMLAGRLSTLGVTASLATEVFQPIQEWYFRTIHRDTHWCAPLVTLSHTPPCTLPCTPFGPVANMLCCL